MPQIELTPAERREQRAQAHHLDPVVHIGADGLTDGVRKEVDTLVQGQVERVLNNLNVVKREEFDVVKEMAEKARSENDALAKRIADLESRLGKSEGA